MSIKKCVFSMVLVGAISLCVMASAPGVMSGSEMDAVNAAFGGNCHCYKYDQCSKLIFSCTGAGVLCFFDGNESNKTCTDYYDPAHPGAPAGICQETLGCITIPPADTAISDSCN